MNNLGDVLDSNDKRRERQGLIRRGTVPELELSHVEPLLDEVPMRLRDYWHILRTRLPMMISIVAAVTLAVALWMAFKPDYYDAKGRVEIDLEKANTGLVESSEAVALNTYPVYLNTQLEIIKSPRLLAAVVKKLDLPHNAMFQRHMNKGGRLTRSLLRMVYLGRKDDDRELPMRNSGESFVAAAPSVSGAALDPKLRSLSEFSNLEKQQSSEPQGETPAADSPVGASTEDFNQAVQFAPYVADLQRKLHVEQMKEPNSALRDTRLVEITYRDSSPRLASRIVNAIADTLVLRNSEVRMAAGIATNNYIRHRVAELQGEIREKEEKLQSYGRTHQILSLDTSQNTALDRLAALNKQLVEAENDRKLAQANQAVAATLTASVALAEDSTKQITDSEVKLADLEQKRAQLLVETTTRWPETREVDEQIAALEKSIQNMRQHAAQVVRTNLHTKYQQAVGHEEALRRAFTEQKRVMLAQNEAAVGYRLRQQEVDTSKSMVDGLLKRLGENDVAQAGTDNNIRVVNYAVIPPQTEPDGPYRLLYVVLAFAISLAFAMALALLLEYLNDTVRSSEELEMSLRLPALGMIPDLDLPERRIFPWMDSRLKAGSL